ncbi:sporulation histidine kinase inhibitor Sda [Ferdinandcohnia sp. Marseille-Q9671]
MRSLTNMEILYAYKEALVLQLDREFIKLLELELKRRLTSSCICIYNHQF